MGVDMVQHTHGVKAGVPLLVLACLLGGPAVQAAVAPAGSRADSADGGLRVQATDARRLSLGERISSFWTRADWTTFDGTTSLKVDPTALRGFPALSTAAGDGAHVGDVGAASRAALASVYFGPSTDGLRATGGMLGLARSSAQRLLPAATASAATTGYERFGAGEPVVQLPYVGVGYSTRWLSGPSSSAAAWGLSADVGLMAGSARSAVRLGQQSLDDTLRDMRLAPLLQLGVTYSF
jgi:hypothetical protein